MASSPLAIILAAGKGKRMGSDLPKVLLPVCGRPMLRYVIDAVRAAGVERMVVVVGHRAELVRSELASEPGVTFAEQAEQLGTGHAVMMCRDTLAAHQGPVLILAGDSPMVQVSSLQAVLAEFASQRPACLLGTASKPDPTGLGRIVRNAAGEFQAIVEEKDASPAERAITEVNMSTYVFESADLLWALDQLKADNAQREYYLTDVIAMAVAEDVQVVTRQPAALHEILGVNNKLDLANLERTHQRNIAQLLLEQGVTLRDPARLDVRGELQCGRDVVIDVNVIIEGKVTLGDGVQIGPNNYLRDVVIGAATEVQPNCVVEEAEIGRDCRIGPFARVRPGSRLADHAHIGNFVEIKNSQIGEGSKANHLTYVGDSVVGKGVNIGAGTITANYDGANKHRTDIRDNASIGSNVVLVAPVTVHEGATIGAGSVITKDAPAGALTLARTKQTTVSGWQRPKKKPKG